MIDNFLKYFYPVLIVTIISAWLLGNNSPIYISDTIKQTDTMALANTYIVFVTLIVIIATIAITIVLAVFVKQYSETKERLLTENLHEVVDAFIKNDTLQKKLINQLFENKVVQDKVSERLDILASNTNEIVDNIKKDNNEWLEKTKKELQEQIYRLSEKVINLESSDELLFDDEKGNL